MNLETLIPPTDLRDYAKDQGWVLLKEAAKDRLYVMTNPHYSEAVMLVVDKLAAMEGKSPQAVIKSLLEVSDDAIAFRVTTPRPDERSLPLAFAGSMVTGAQQLLMASACTVLKPQAHHPRLRRTEAQQFLEAARFRHTQPGSFVLNVSCPVQALDVQAPLLPNEADASIPKPANEGRVSLVRIQHDYFPRIEEVRRALRSKQQHVEDVFPATVERLDGEMGPDGKRAGEVILRLLTADGDDLVRARANLTAEQYRQADEAHMLDGAFVKVTGKLHPGRQPRQLSDITSFELLIK